MCHRTIAPMPKFDQQHLSQFDDHSGDSKIKIAGEVAILLTKEGIHHQTAKVVAG